MQNSNPPLPVPPNIHSNQRTARAVALTFVLIWLAIHIAGSAKLEHLFEETQTAFDKLLQSGEANWVAVARDDYKLCLGYLKTVFDDSQAKPALSLHANFSLPLFKQPMNINLNLNARFDSYYKLTDVSSKVRAGTTALSLNSNDEDEDKFLITITTKNRLREFSVIRPQPIFLEERTPGQFNLQIPGYLQQLLQQQGQSAEVTQLAGIDLLEANDPEAKYCKNAGTDRHLEADAKINVFDIGKVLEYFRITEDHQIVKELLEDI